MSLGVGFEVAEAQVRPSGLLCLPAACAEPVDPDVELSATSPAPSLPAWRRVSCHDDNGLNL